jgi:uncharacterized membrane protein YhaH (DUF805 family)
MPLLSLLAPRGRKTRLDYFRVLAVGAAMEACLVVAVRSYVVAPEYIRFAALSAFALPFSWMMVSNDLARIRDLGWQWLFEIPVAPVYFCSLWPYMLRQGDAGLAVAARSLGLYGLWLVGFLLFRRGTTGANRFGADPLDRRTAAPAVVPVLLPAPESPPAVEVAPITAEVKALAPPPKPVGDSPFVQCPNGHFYNPREPACPFCAAGDSES